MDSKEELLAAINVFHKHYKEHVDILSSKGDKITISILWCGSCDRQWVIVLDNKEPCPKCGSYKRKEVPPRLYEH